MTYSTSKPQLIYDDLDDDWLKGSKQMGYLYFTIVILGLALSFINPLYSIIIYALLVAVIICLTLVGKLDLIFTFKSYKKKSNKH